MTPVAALANLIGGTIHDDTIYTPRGRVWSSPFGGRVRLEPWSGRVVDLGPWHTPAHELAAAYEAAVA